MNYLIPILTILVAYLVGSVPFGLLFVRWLAEKDLRTVGSGNIGATNARRAAGTPAGVMVLCCDILKGVLPVFLAQAVMADVSYGGWITAAAAVAAILGHMFPVYLKFRPSGKGVATALGIFLVISPLSAITALAVFIILTALTRRVSVGSMGGAAALAPATWLVSQDPAIASAGLAAAILIIVRHKENIRRLKQGREPSL